MSDIEAILEACLLNATRILDSARAVMAPGRYHVAYHLAALAMEEIGKHTLILADTRGIAPASEDEESGPDKWMEDHERKLFWALWLPTLGSEADWRLIPKYLDLARAIHLARLSGLYFNPDDLGAQNEISEKTAQNLVDLTASRLEMEKAKEYRDLDEQERSDMQWFFLASRNPELTGFVFSKRSMDKQTENQGSRTAWMRWLRETVEENQRSAAELFKKEIGRQRPAGEERLDDKWKIRIRLKSWSHSIRANQLNAWNKVVDGIKLFHTDDNTELIVEFTLGTNALMNDLWHFGMNQCVIFVTSLNIATGGFFWWYLPSYISRFYESITDVETGRQVVIERVPQLRISWGHQALKQEDLHRPMATIFMLVSQAQRNEAEVFLRYFQALALLAKNDIFFQFEHHIVSEFMECFKMALRVYGDWDGNPATFEATVDSVFAVLSESEDFTKTVKEMALLGASVKAKTLARPVTLQDVGNAKIAFDAYIQIKAALHMRREIEKRNAKPTADIA